VAGVIALSNTFLYHSAGMLNGSHDPSGSLKRIPLPYRIFFIESNSGALVVVDEQRFHSSKALLLEHLLVKVP
jgi:hypothetical protein